MNSMTPRSAQATQEHTVGFAEDVRRLYFEALRLEGSLDSLVAGRKTAEAVCQHVSRLLPENLQRTCAGQGLPSRIGLLESNGVLTREVSAALRTLAAYGNYAAHYESGTHRAAPDAARSAMASLSLVAAWALKGDRIGDADEQPILLLREPPGPPRVVERMILRQAVPWVPELTEQTMNLGSYQYSVTPDQPIAVQFARMMAFYEDSINVVAHVCRVVLARETQVVPDSMTFEQLIMLMAFVSEARPARVPRSICLDLESLSTFRSAIAQRLSSTDDPAPFLIQAKTQNVADRVVRWFDTTYLARSSIERRWVTWMLFASGLFFAWFVGVWFGEDDGRSLAYAEIQTKLCRSVEPESVATFCAPPPHPTEPEK